MSLHQPNSSGNRRNIISMYAVAVGSPKLRSARLAGDARETKHANFDAMWNEQRGTVLRRQPTRKRHTQLEPVRNRFRALAHSPPCRSFGAAVGVFCIGLIGIMRLREVLILTTIGMVCGWKELFTAQAALAFQQVSDAEQAEALLATIAAQISPVLIYATLGDELTTGLMIRPTSTFADFKYFRLPHVGSHCLGNPCSERLEPFS